MENWDGEGDACLNSNCCEALHNNVKISFIVTGVMAGAVAIMATLLLLMACYLKEDLDGYNRDDSKCDVLVIIFIIMMVVGGGGFGVIFFISAAAVPYPGDAAMTGSILDAGVVDSHLLTPHEHLCMASAF